MGAAGPPSTSATLAERTVAAYDVYARTYAEITRKRLPIGDEALRRFAAALPAGSSVLELASGPGWDADDLEARGLKVRRTDLSQGFIQLQRDRGKEIERLDLTTDPLGGPWDGLVALYVLQHVERSLIDGVIARMAACLRPGGLFLTSFQEGDLEEEQTGSEGGTYHVVQWPPQDLLDRLIRNGLVIDWSHSFQGSDARWTILIARRP